MPLLLAQLTLALLLAPAQGTDADGDGDGLSDFQEVHKYRTDPRSPDSDGDGVADGDPDERREWTYTVRTIIQVLPPVTPDVLCDDYQDARILETPGENVEYVELEVVHYPLCTAGDAIEGDRTWRASLAGLEPWLASGPTSNWDEGSRATILAGLGEQGLDVNALDDRTLVEQASAWLLEHARSEDGFTTFAAELVDGEVRVHPLLAESVEGSAAERGYSVAQAWQRELFAKGMLEHGVRGSCTSSAIYLNGCLRAVGVPSRIVLAVPLIDASDERELELLDRLRHPRVRRIAKQGTAELGDSWASHTFNEVWVGGRWRRLNYSKLGQGILDPGLFGMITHVATFSDWTDGNLASTWGVRETLHRFSDDAFGGANPYSTLTLSDRFGVHSGLDPATLVDDGDFTALTIERAYWYDDPEKHPVVAMRLDDPETAGHVLVHVRESLAGQGSAQYGPFWGEASKRFALRAPGHPDVPLAAARGWWYDEDDGVREFYLRIEPADLPTMQPGVAYSLVPLASVAGREWLVAAGVTLVRPEPEADAVSENASAGRVELTIDAAAWSDGPDSPTGPIPGMGRALLLRMGPSNDFPAHKAFTEACDQVFLLEADDAPTVFVSTGVGGFTDSKDSYAIATPDSSGWNALAEGVRYTIRPRNESPTHRWRLARPLTIVP